MSIQSSIGSPFPLGATIEKNGVHFAVYAPKATTMTVVLFWNHGNEWDMEIPMHGPSDGIWHVSIQKLPLKGSYAYRMDNQIILSDPYARKYANLYRWGDFSQKRIPLHAHLPQNKEFDWQGVSSPQIPLKDLVIYEMHVRGLTIHPSSKVKHPGTFAGVIEKIDYLKKLGINAVELMPVYEFDETLELKVYSVVLQERINYWGYNPISFFVPMSRYSSDPDNAIDEFKTMVRELHRAKIEVILDVVYNHTGEGDNHLISMRGLDRAGYYMIDENNHDRNYTGCGNTFQTNQKMSAELILDSLHYWVEEMHVDGFRFDLASILIRGSDGSPMTSPPVLEAIANDPILQKVKLIAEPWDAMGLSQVGQFYKWGHWSEWNNSFRDHVRGFIKGTDHEVGHFAAALCGSQPTYPTRSPQSSINFITAHDGFCLRDLVTYQNKHNIDNGENNRDGTDHNLNWNCGAEGPTQDTTIHELRERQMRNFWLALLLAEGVPMILMGDEYGHTRKGNNNPYVQDNEINWTNWENIEKNSSQIEFVSALIHYRQLHPELRREQFFNDTEIVWHGHMPHHPDWKPHSRFIAYEIKSGKHLYIAFNSDFHSALVFLPQPPINQVWRLVVNTESGYEKQHLRNPNQGAILEQSIEMAPHSALLVEANRAP